MAAADHLEPEFSFAMAAGLEGSGFLGTADDAVAGFLATAAEGGRLTSGAKRKTINTNSLYVTVNKKNNYVNISILALSIFLIF